ncbi:hypothetical protein U1Q18_019428 [Sarracenia purpurea var. burkii]
MVFSALDISLAVVSFVIGLTNFSIVSAKSSIHYGDQLSELISRISPFSCYRRGASWRFRGFFISGAGRKIPNRAQIRTEVISVQTGEEDSGGFGAGKRREEEMNQSPSGEDERRLAQLRRWVFLVDWSKEEGDNSGSGSVSAQGGRRQQRA